MSDFYKHILLQSPGYLVWKDTNSIYLGANDNFRQLIGLKTVNEVIGCTDFDMPWSQTHAKQYRSDDQYVLRGLQKLNYVETQLLPNQTIIQVVANKVPLLDPQGNIIGVLCNYSEKNRPRPEPTSDYRLTRKQLTCLQLIALGMTAKEIANQLNLSTRTVEFYTDILKTKLHCNTKTQLIHKALALGLVDNYYL